MKPNSKILIIITAIILLSSYASAANSITGNLTAGWLGHSLSDIKGRNDLVAFGAASFTNTTCGSFLPSGCKDLTTDNGDYFNDRGEIKPSLHIEYTKCKTWRLDPLVKAHRPLEDPILMSSSNIAI
jgi:hypothetical protein